jgi:iodothyronine deiodinase-like protein
MGFDTFMELLRKHLSDKDFNRMMAFTAAMEPDRRIALMQFLAERETLAPAVGADAPDFRLPRLASSEQVQLSSFRGSKPVALIFGSYTWPPFRAQAGHLEELHRRFGDRVEFFVIYIREAHPTDEWQVESNESEGVTFEQPTTLSARSEIAQVCALKLELSIPTLIDDMENSTDRKYYALPDRLYLVGRDGRVAYRGGPGPFGFVAAELERAIEEYLGATPSQAASKSP